MIICMTSVTSTEKAVLRELAARYSQAASEDIQQKRIDRMRDNNDLKAGRPPVLIDEIPWHEMDIDGQLVTRTAHPFAQSMETFFRRRLFVHEHLKCDAVMENFYPIQKAFSSTGNGLAVDETRLATDEKNHIVSHQYHDRLADEEALEKMRLPEITVYPEEDTRHLEIAEDILGGILPVKLRGIGIYYAPWDDIPSYHGVENTLFDLLDRPEFMKKVIEKFTESGKHLLSQYEAHGLLDPRMPLLHCTPSYISGSPAEDVGGEERVYRMKDMWFRSMAQLFGSVSADMHWEFDLQYSLPMMEQCAYTYYGCCEALDNKINMLKKIPNLRKIGVSPWANVEKCAEQIGKNYVLARKPNPSNAAILTDPEVVRREIIQTVEASLRYGCPYEFVLKDISTVGSNPHNLIVWAKTVSDVLDRYYA